jgi:hypothetical protein
VLPSDTRGRNTSPSARKRHSGKRLLPRVPGKGTRGRGSFPKCFISGTRGRGHLPRVLEHGTQGRHFLFFWQTVPSKGAVKCEFPFVSAPLPRVLHSGKKAFPECHPSPSARGFAALRKASLPRVHFFSECNTRGRLASLSARFLALREEFGTRGISILP